MQKHFDIAGYDFYVCIDRHDHGWYIAIPNWNVCVEADDPANWYYNMGRLRNEDDLPKYANPVRLHADEIAKAIAKEWNGK